MTSLTRGQRVFFGVICAAALLVAVLGLFFPQQLAAIFTWLVLPPLHARFVGSIYLFGAVYTGLAAAARYRGEVRHTPALIALWTGMLGLLSLFNLGAFDFSQAPAPIWIASYTIYPLIALWFAWQEKRKPSFDVTGAPIPVWIRGILLVQGVIMTLLALALLLAPNRAASLWPWAITPFLAQTYAGPMLAYGIGSLLTARAPSLPEIRPIIPAMLAFTAAVLISSLIHRSLFNVAEIPDLLWFVLFGLTAVALAMITLRVLPAKAQS